MYDREVFYGFCMGVIGFIFVVYGGIEVLVEGVD